MAAIHAVQAANDAAKHAAEHPSDPVNKLAKLLKTKEYTGKMIVDFPDGFVGTVVRGAIANKPPMYNLTGFADYFAKLKNQPFASLPKLNYTPPEVVWEGDIKEAINKTHWDIKVGEKNLTAWKAALKATIQKDDALVQTHELAAVDAHARKAGRKMI